jgi:hypothetical protein
MGILKSAARGLRNFATGKGGKTLGQRLKDGWANPGTWTEDIASGLGVRTRGAAKYANAGRPEVRGPTFNMTQGGYNPNGVVQKAIPASGQYRDLTGAGMAAQGVGLGGAGYLGYKMIAGTEPSHDENGVKTGMQNEEALKVREKFQKEKLGGANKFNNALLEHNSRNSQWVKTAIKGIGMEKYKQMRAAVAADPSKAGALHTALVSELAKVGDEEMMKQAASEAYVLPGLARVGDDARRVIVMSPQKGKDKKTSFTALQYEYDEGDDQ